MRRRDHAYVDRDRPGLADRDDLALLQHPQKCGLQRELQIAELVEEQGALVRAADEPRTVLLGIRIGASSHAEELALDERIGNSAAVHGNEGARATAHRMHRARDELLAGPGLAQEHDRDSRERDGIQSAKSTRQRRAQRRHSADRVRVGHEVQRLIRLGLETVAKQIERASELDEIAVVQGHAVDPSTADPRAVLRVQILEHAAAQHATHARVRSRDADVRLGDAQDGLAPVFRTVRADRAAAEDHDIDAAEGMAHRGHEWLPAIAEPNEVRLRPGLVTTARLRASRGRRGNPRRHRQSLRDAVPPIHRGVAILCHPTLKAASAPRDRRPCC